MTLMQAQQNIVVLELSALIQNCNFNGIIRRAHNFRLTEAFRRRDNFLP
jgi:hypothetical protein